MKIAEGRMLSGSELREFLDQRLKIDATIAALPLETKVADISTDLQAGQGEITATSARRTGCLHGSRAAKPLIQRDTRQAPRRSSSSGEAANSSPLMVRPVLLALTFTSRHR